MSATQYFFPNGLSFIFSQLNINGSPASTGYKVGLFTGTLQDLISNGLSSQELVGEGYSRLSTTFGAPQESFPTLFQDNGAVITETALTGDWFIYVNTGGATAQIGMTVSLTGEDSLIITGLPDGDGSGGTEIRFVLSAPLANDHEPESFSGGDAVSGVKSIGSAVLFSALAAWPAVGGYFVVADAEEYDSSNYIYASTFADGATPILSPNDTLQVTPIWLMSSY